MLNEVHNKTIKKKNLKLSEFTSLKIRLAFGQRDPSNDQQPLTSDDLLVTDRDHFFSQKEHESPAVNLNNQGK